MFSKLLLIGILSGCAYGKDDQQQIYGYTKPPPNNSDGGIVPWESPADDPMTFGCFLDTINNYDGTVSTFYICDGVEFNVGDIVDPPPSNRKQ